MTQEQIIKNLLISQKQVTRNWAVKNYITRLGSIVNRLNGSGWKIIGKYEKYEHGTDYVYTLIEKPSEFKIGEKTTQKQLFSTKRMY